MAIFYFWFSWSQLFIDSLGYFFFNKKCSIRLNFFINDINYIRNIASRSTIFCWHYSFWNVTIKKWIECCMGMNQIHKFFFDKWSNHRQHFVHKRWNMNVMHCSQLQWYCFLLWQIMKHTQKLITKKSGQFSFNRILTFYLKVMQKFLHRRYIHFR